MANLRIVSVTVIDSTNIAAKFTENLSEDLVTSNVQIISQTPGVPSAMVIAVSVVGNTLNIETQPLTPLAAYFIIFQSTSSTLFASLNGDSVLFMDGVTNRQLIIGPVTTDNPVKEYLDNFLRDSVYDTDDPSIISKYIQGISSILSKSLYDIRQSKNENYLSFTVTDEAHVRAAGPFDRLNEEGAYEILRVGKTVTGANLSNLTQIASFPPYPVSLFATPNTEILTVNSTEENGTFDLGTFTLNLSKNSVIILNSITFAYSSIHLPYTYDITTLGYQINNSKYDPDFAFTYLLLNSNQIRLNEKVLDDPNFSTENIAQVMVTYQFQDTGKIIDPTTLVIDTILPSGREVLPPIENTFALKHAPIVTNTDVIGTVGTATFVDPNAVPGSNTPHPAFLYEVPFRLDYLPARPGEYSVDYNTGNVYVFGADTNRDGTGPFPPLAVYLYRYVFVSQIDYVYDIDSADLVSLPNGNLISSPANIIYSFEEVLAQGIDYKVSAHIEVLSERIGNRLIALNAIQPLNFPVTNVFRIFNETSGEVYRIFRWSDNKIYFQYNKAPNIVDETGERASFQDIFNEVLFVSASTPVTISTNIFKVFLNNNNIIDESEDAIGSSINSSAQFSNTNIFIQEVYFDNNLTEAQNNARLLNIGDYQVDYVNGTVWCLVPTTQSFSIGTISYKRGYIAPANPHVITVDDIYYRSSVLSPKTKQFTYINFADGSILPSSFDVSNETFFNGQTTLPYQLLGGQVGTFMNVTFVPGVANNILFIRGLYEYEDILNNRSPINFASVTVSNGKTITVSPLVFQEYHNVQFDGTHFYVLLNTNLLYQSPNITLTVSVVRLSDNAQLWNGSGTVVLGSPFKLVLPGINSPHAGDAVLVIYSFTILDLSRIIVDYNKGDYFIDYSYLADEIIISYEYGDNYLDFRESSALSPGDNYFVTYKVGALRDGLLKNFGTLIDISVLNSLDVTFERERYRDALIAAMQSFTQGPTVASMKSIVENIVHTPPDIIESAFQNWTLGLSLLNPEPIETTGNLSTVPAKYDNGVFMVDQDIPGQTISFPMSSNLRLEQGSFECWVIPEWNGIDNESDITIKILKNGVPLPPEQIFIGPGGYHPSIDGYMPIVLDKDERVLGKPNESLDGVFIYYTLDAGGKFNRWYIDVIDGYADGYSDGYFDGSIDGQFDGYVDGEVDGYFDGNINGSFVDGYIDGYFDAQFDGILDGTLDGYTGHGIKNYSIYITTNGKFYDVKSTVNPQPGSDKIYSGTNTITYTITGTADPAQGITFLADTPHYIFDFGESTTSNRFSLFKDESGYMNFKVIDKNAVSYLVSGDVSFWTPGQQHHVAASWALNSAVGGDEMHLFLDGLEVPNIIKHKNKIVPYLHEKFRTVDPEEVAGAITQNIVSSTDLVTVAGSNAVTSSINFSAEGITPGGVLYIEEPGFSTLGYLITFVNGNTLTLSVPMPLSTTGSLFSVNKTSFDILTEVDLYPNMTVTLLHSPTSPAGYQGSDLVVTGGSNIVSSPSINFTNIGVLPGYVIRIPEPSFAITYTIITVNGHSLTLTDNMSSSFGAAPYFIYPNVEQEIPGVRALHPAYAISRDGYCNNVLTILDQAQQNDLVLIRTLGLNNRRMDKKYYVWGNTNNIIMTKLPAPILLCDVKITHILLDSTNIGPSNSTFGGGIFISNQIPTDQPSISDNGRTLSVNITGGNIDFSTSVMVTINGTVNSIPNTSETVVFSMDDTKSTMNKFETVNYVVVSCKPINPAKNCLVVKIEELYPITVAENSATVPIIRYSYQMLVGNTLSGSGSTVTDTNAFFSIETVGNYLVIHSPSPVAGQYQITGVSADHHSATITGSLASFTDGIYEVLNVTTFRTGLQNGFFTFEQAADGYVGVPYDLVQGFYRFDYYTNLSIPLDIGRLRGYVGTDINGNNIANATIDELQILSEKLTDVRIGEVVSVNQEYITKDFNSLVALRPTVNTLMLAHFDTQPFTNDSDTYITATNSFIQSGHNVNDNFNKSIAITNTPVIVDNTGILNSKKEGTIEFWVNPMFDTGNDPNYRYYFDSTSMVSEKVVSINNATVKVAGKISSILNVKLQVGSQNVDYFVGGTIDSDMQTIFLNRQLPNQQTPVVVNYIPTGTEGDRISIYKDPFGYVNFDVTGGGILYQIRSPVFWEKNTWHRLKALYRVNSGLGSDEVRFFIDGYERGNVSFGPEFLFGQSQVFGSSFIGENGLLASITLKDTFNELFIGSDFTGKFGANALIDNLRISDIARPLFFLFGDSIDTNYSTNLNIVFPVTTDLNTTLLLDFDTLVAKTTNFSTLKNKKTGLFDFTVNIFDQFGIVSSSSKVKQVLETLINTLKPANSRVFIKYNT